MAERRPPTPSEVKRILRQEAGFGCCRCGFPVYDYHHILPYEVEQYFRASDMMVLCPNCHREVTSGAMTEEEQRFHKSNPYNIQRGSVDGQLKIEQSDLVISTGGLDFINNGLLITVDEEPLLELRRGGNGQLLLSLSLYDQSDNLCAVISDNEWISSDSTTVWDLEYGFRWLKIRERARKIWLDIDARVYPVRLMVNLWRHGQRIRLNRVGMFLSGIIQNRSITELGLVGMYIKVDTESKKIELTPTPWGGVFVSESDREKRVQEGLKQLRQLGF